MITQKEVEKETDELYDHLIKAYEIAGGLRDSFTGIGNGEADLKEFCNFTRGQIYKIREKIASFRVLTTQKIK